MIEREEELLIQAHLGAQSGGVTREAVVAAAAWAAIVEVDVQLSRDEEFVLYHDYTFPDGRWVHETDYADCARVLRAELPVHSDFLDLDGAASLARELGVILCLDVKSGMGREHAIHHALVRWLEATATDAVHVSDWDHAGLRLVKALHPQVTVRGAVRGRLVDPIAAARSADLDGLNLAWDCTRPKDVASLRDYGYVVAFFGGWGNRFLPHAQACEVDIVISDSAPSGDSS